MTQLARAEYSHLDLETDHRPTVSQVKWRQNLNPFKYDTTVPF